MLFLSWILSLIEPCLSRPAVLFAAKLTLGRLLHYLKNLEESMAMVEEMQEDSSGVRGQAIAAGSGLPEGSTVIEVSVVRPFCAFLRL